MVIGMAFRMAINRSLAVVIAGRTGTLNDLFELTSVEPNTPAFGAVINFHSLCI
jgi:hypothetical protein